MCIEHHYTQTNTNNLNKTRALLQQLEAKTNRTLFLCGNRNGHHNTEPRTKRPILGQHKKLKLLSTIFVLVLQCILGKCPIKYTVYNKYSILIGQFLSMSMEIILEKFYDYKACSHFRPSAGRYVVRFVKLFIYLFDFMLFCVTIATCLYWFVQYWSVLTNVIQEIRRTY
jgi:hypothetical protein